MVIEIIVDVYHQILKRHLGNEYMLRDYKMLLNKPDYAVVLLTVDHLPYKLILKLAGPNAPIAAPFDRSFDLNKRVRTETTIPTYEAIAVDMSYSYVPYRYLLLSYIEGHSWAEVRNELGKDDFIHLYRQLGDAVAQLHTLTCNGFGELGATESNYLAALTIRARRRIVNPSHQDLFISLLHEHQALFRVSGPARLTHEDLNPGNIIVRKKEGNWELAAIIDFDSAWAGGHESDLARLEIWRGMIGEGFFESYRKIQSISADYAKRRPFYQLLWCLEFAMPSQDHNEDTKRTCDELGIPAIRF